MKTQLSSQFTAFMLALAFVLTPTAWTMSTALNCSVHADTTPWA